MFNRAKKHENWSHLEMLSRVRRLSDTKTYDSLQFSTRNDHCLIEIVRVVFLWKTNPTSNILNLECKVDYLPLAHDALLSDIYYDGCTETIFIYYTSMEQSNCPRELFKCKPARKNYISTFPSLKWRWIVNVSEEIKIGKEL